MQPWPEKERGDALDHSVQGCIPPLVSIGATGKNKAGRPVFTGGLPAFYSIINICFGKNQEIKPLILGKN
jgi:hypothetical protein